MHHNVTHGMYRAQRRNSRGAERERAPARERLSVALERRGGDKLGIEALVLAKVQGIPTQCHTGGCRPAGTGLLWKCKGSGPWTRPRAAPEATSTVRRS